MKAAIEETSRRRERQLTYNAEHGITPASVKKAIAAQMVRDEEPSDVTIKGKGNVTETIKPEDFAKTIKRLQKQMHEAANNLEFEEAARLRDQIKKLEAQDLGLGR